MGHTRVLFKAAVEIARECCFDRLLQIYFIGLRIVSTILAPPICGADISANIINQSIKPFIPMLVNKISELNYRARDISLHTLVSLFHHPSVDIRNLIENIMDIVDKEGEQPPDKQPWRIILARLEILLHILKEFGVDHQLWNWKIINNKLVFPTLFHPNADVRYMAVELILQFYKLIGKEVKEAILNIEDLRPNLLQNILEKMSKWDLEKPKQDEEVVKPSDLTIVEEEKEEILPSPRGSPKTSSKKSPKTSSKKSPKLSTPKNLSPKSAKKSPKSSKKSDK